MNLSIKQHRLLNSLILVFAAILTGAGLTTLYLSNAVSYLSDDSETCINCHVMNTHYASWQHSSHRRFTSCNECHVPQDNLLRKYYFKAMDGLNHATVFTTHNEPHVIRIKEAGIAVVQENCIRCHRNQIHSLSIGEVSGENYTHGNGKLCWGCHREVPHGNVTSLSSVPFVKAVVMPKAMKK